jgi:hypothetical protein
MSRQASIKKHEIPEGWSPEAADFINKVKLKLTYNFSYYKENQSIV